MVTLWGNYEGISQDSALLSQFTRGNKALIKKGYAPFTIPEEQIGGRKTFEIHHNERIVDRGRYLTWTTCQ
ncbi:hypothetical protein [Escherichia coli]|uniref:hypothetical protein n=1 Tax=Escherichia coli TaxID=562 RepID=UPI003CC7FC2C